MNVVAGLSSGLQDGLFARLSEYRCKVFVEKLGWNLKHENGQELDQFDREDTLYVVAQDEAGNVQGCARLLPTTDAYLLSDVFPEILHGKQPPCSPEVWELSRFAAVDFSAAKTSALGQFSSPIAVKLLEESLAVAGRLGAKRLITVSPIGVERLLYKAGFLVHRAAPPIMTADGHPLVACLIEIPESQQRGA
jgi:N-acyl-L-homoserine lactone synthetase